MRRTDGGRRSSADPHPASTLISADAGGDLCATYCSEIAKSCSGANAQYRDTTECLSACALLEPGTEQDGALDTVGCRLRKARAATDLAACVVAGPFGGGVCGDRCDAFCTIVDKNCSKTTAPPYDSRASCIETCDAQFKLDTTAGEGPVHDLSGHNTLNCREYHAMLSLGANAAAAHCPHTGVVSTVCPASDAGP